MCVDFYLTLWLETSRWRMCEESTGFAPGAIWGEQEECAPEASWPGQLKDPVGILRQMMLARECDRRSGLAVRQGKAWFAISSAGHEALGALGTVLTSRDAVFPHYRDRALAMARGMTVRDMARDLMGRAGSHSGGRAMASHFSHRPGNVFSLASPTAAQCLPAAGYAWASLLQGKDDVALCSIGDASSRQGEFFEAVAFAVHCALPIIFLVSDNGYGISTSTANMSAHRLGLLPENIVEEVDGVDPDAVAEAGARAVAKARAGGGPTVLWCDLDRLDPHSSSDDHRVYRTPKELAALRDPVVLFRDRLLRLGIIDEGWYERVRRETAQEVEEEFEKVFSEPVASSETISNHIFGPEVAPPFGGSGGSRDGTIVAAFRDALRDELADRPSMVIFGEDVADPKGGVFGLTKGLGAEVEGRVFNAPLAEATIVGVAVGLAAAGMQPVAEIQFVDFAGPAWNQISNQLATLRWRTLSEWQCPVLLYAPWGGYLPGGGIWHSQSNESLFTHLPGLRVAVPSTPADTQVVVHCALAGSDPTLVLLPKHLMRLRHPSAELPYDPYRARIRRSGEDVTVVTWGNGVSLAMAAATAADQDGVSVEVIDLCWLTPVDLKTVAASVRRTGRLVVVQEDNCTSSFGAGLIAQVVGGDDEFFSLLGAPQLVSRQDLHVPFHPDLEFAVLPAVQDVVAAIRAAVNPSASAPNPEGSWG